MLVRPAAILILATAAAGCAVVPSREPGGDGADTGGVDADLDGDPALTDCDDADGEVHSEATETCNGKDDDCSGLVDDAGACDEYGVVLRWDAATYLLGDEAVGWDDAYAACENIPGYRMVMVETSSENDGLSGSILGASFDLPLRWIGLTKRTGEWLWVDGSPWVSPDVWIGAEPDNADSGAEPPYDVAFLDPSVPGWGDASATHSGFAGYACEPESQ